MNSPVPVPEKVVNGMSTRKKWDPSNRDLLHRSFYKVECCIGCLCKDLLLPVNHMFVHQDTAVTDNGIDRTAVAGIHDVRNRVMERVCSMPYEG